MKIDSKKKICCIGLLVLTSLLLLTGGVSADGGDSVVGASLYEVQITVDENIAAYGYEVYSDAEPRQMHHTTSWTACVMNRIGEQGVSIGGFEQVLVGGESSGMPEGWILHATATKLADPGVSAGTVTVEQNRVTVEGFKESIHLDITVEVPTVTVTVTFDSNGGSSVEPQVIPQGSAAAEPAAPSRSGYTFSGWYTDNGTFQHKWDFADAVNADMTLYAKWVAVPCTVTFEPENGSASWKEVYEYGEKIVQPEDPVKTGYVLEGWYNGSVKWDFENDVVVSDMTLTAHWTPVTYFVKFNANGGSGTMDNQQFVYDEKKQLTLNTFTRNMYSFQGWAVTPNGDVVYKNGEIVMNLSSVQDYVVNLYAVWKYTGGSGGSSSSAVSYCLVQFEPFTGQEIESQWLKEGSLVQRPEDPVNAGFIFGGWYTESGIEWDFATGKVYYSMTLYAKWIYQDTPVSPDEPVTPVETPVPVIGVLAGLLGAGAAVMIKRRK